MNLVLISAIVLFLSLVFILVFKKSTKTSSRKLPPGPIIWPLIGNLFEIKAADRVYPHVALAKLAKKYGHIMGIGFGSTYCVVISGYNEMKELFKRTELTMHRYGFPYATERSFNKHLGILWNGGEDWKEVRRFTMRTLIDFGFGKTKRLELAMKEELDVVLKEIRVSARNNDGVWFVDTHALATFAINVLWLLVGRCRFERGDEIIQENLRLSDRVAKIMSFDNIDNVFPGLKKWVPWIVPHEAHMQVHRAFQAWAKNLIEETKQRRVQRVETEAQNFIEVFIDEIERNRGKESPFTEEQLIVVLLDLFLAGSETTSMTLNWAILFLTLNSECQQKLREEIKEAKERLGEITIQEADKLTYLNAVLLEVSRMGIVVPMAIRKASEDTSFNGIIIPKGTPVFSNMVPIFTDEEFWGDPKVFRPERYLDSSGLIIPRIAERVALFGFGKRKCIAATLAWDTMKMFLIALFGTVRIEAIDGQEPSPETPIQSFTIQPRPYSVRIIQN